MKLGLKVTDGQVLVEREPRGVIALTSAMAAGCIALAVSFWHLGGDVAFPAPLALVFAAGRLGDAGGHRR